MKYYCKECESILELTNKLIAKWKYEEAIYDGEGDWNTKWKCDRVLCDICSTEYISHEVWMKCIPDYETPEQYKERTGKPYSDNGLVWIRSRWLTSDTWGQWEVKRFGDVLRAVIGQEEMVITDPPVPPPDDWQPEVNNE